MYKFNSMNELFIIKWDGSEMSSCEKIMKTLRNKFVSSKQEKEIT